MEDFVLRAALASVGTALAASVLGCFVVWRRLAYFGDAVAHAAILGVALSLALEVSVTLGVGAVALLAALGVHRLDDGRQGTDTLLGVLAHGALAVGLVAVALMSGQRLNLESYLFGDVLFVGPRDLWTIWAGALLVLVVLWRQWQGLLIATLSPDLAVASGVDPRRVRLILTLLLAAVVAVAIKVVGALLITALLVIPAAAARRAATTPEAMALLSAAAGVTAALTGVAGSVALDTPTGPTIVCAAVILFALSRLVGRPADGG